MIGLRGIPSREGGVEVAVSELAPRLVKQNLNIYVYARSGYNPQKIKIYRGVNVITIPTINSKHLEAIVHTFLSTWHAILSGFDIIHYHADGNALFCWLPRLFGIKTVVTVHGQDWQREKWGRCAKVVLRVGEYFGIHLSNQYISVSKKISRIYHYKNGHYIPNGIPSLEDSDKFPLGDHNLKNNYILYLGRIVPEKGLGTLIDAYIDSKIKIPLVIAGGSLHASKYEMSLKSKAVGQNIIFTGPLYGSEKASILRNAKIFVLPSTLEGMPIVLLEAAASNTPIVISDIIENIEAMTDDNGVSNVYHFKAGNYIHLSATLKKVLGSYQSAMQKAENNKIFCQQYYSWDKITRETKQVYYA